MEEWMGDGWGRGVGRGKGGETVIVFYKINNLR